MEHFTNMAIEFHEPTCQTLYLTGALKTAHFSKNKSYSQEWWGQRKCPLSDASGCTKTQPLLPPDDVYTVSNQEKSVITTDPNIPYFFSSYFLSPKRNDWDEAELPHLSCKMPYLKQLLSAAQPHSSVIKMSSNLKPGNRSNGAALIEKT